MIERLTTEFVQGLSERELMIGIAAARFNGELLVEEANYRARIKELPATKSAPKSAKPRLRKAKKA